MRVLCFCVLQDLEDELWPQAILRWMILEPSVLLDSSDSPHPHLRSLGHVFWVNDIEYIEYAYNSIQYRTSGHRGTNGPVGFK